MSASTSLTTLNELADLNNCNNILFYQCKHHLNVTDTYLWLAKAPNGPSVKFQLQNLHTMDELKLSGNCLKGSRPILSFSNEFDQVPQWQLLRELFTQVDHYFAQMRSVRLTKADASVGIWCTAGLEKEQAVLRPHAHL